MRQRSGTGTCSTGGRLSGGRRTPVNPSGSSVTGTGGCGSGAEGGGGTSGAGRRRGVAGRVSSPASPSVRSGAMGPDVFSARAGAAQSRMRLANMAYRGFPKKAQSEAVFEMHQGLEGVLIGRVPLTGVLHVPGRCEGGQPTAPTELVRTGAAVAAISKAGAAAFFSTQGNAFTPRTAAFIIQPHFPPGLKE